MKFSVVLLLLCALVTLQNVESRPYEIVINTSVSATAVASVDTADHMKRFTNVATANAEQNHHFNIFLPQP